MIKKVAFFFFILFAIFIALVRADMMAAALVKQDDEHFATAGKGL